MRYLTCKIFLSATCTLDEPDKHFSHKLLLYFAFFGKMSKKSDLSPECQKFVKKSCLSFLVRKRQRRIQLSHLKGYIIGHIQSYTSVHCVMNGKRPCKSNRPKE